MSPNLWLSLKLSLKHALQCFALFDLKMRKIELKAIKIISVTRAYPGWL